MKYKFKLIITGAPHEGSSDLIFNGIEEIIEVRKNEKIEAVQQDKKIILRHRRELHQIK